MTGVTPKPNELKYIAPDICIGIVFLCVWDWMKKLRILDLKFGFYIQNYQYGQVATSKLANLVQHTTKIRFKKQIIGSSG